MKPIQVYDSVYRYPVINQANDSMSDMSDTIMPLVVCLDGIGIAYVNDDGTPAWSHYQDVPPPYAMERIETLAHTIATHYPTG